MTIVEHALTTPWEGVLLEPAAGNGAGVLVLAGSSGRIHRERARLLAEEGFLTLAVRWFGGPGQPPGICEVPLETFVAGVDLLRAHGASRIGLVGWSKGAEAAMLTAVRDPRIDAVAALSPTAVTWANVGPGHDGRDRPYRSSWTWRGRPLPFVPYDDDWLAEPRPAGPAAVLGWYERSERTYADRLPAAAIPVERAAAELLLVAGGDDRMWASLRYAEQLTARRPSARLLAAPAAGHRLVLPGETAPAPSPHYDYGGSDQADARFGAAVRPVLLDLLRGTPPVSQSVDDGS
ncbi:acyl-CoA thioesterase [Kitasatospora sp. MMS16-BH015]|uniref:acyl-CoA thioester hydrolase/BAAT C-terminal domain-containing protein n=1 Tax=Kitasatospora sp. MMS16-BH015 TaxID=2018025 RepID=UPI000CA0D530|nr:acyl-CoA thioester hydrolase/BAAT C-terminal domain-containing protein [Kitasatospora sp. MMS16-BH015]AUG75328.1 acyl-CoA thioesterase [Kitasatospora sp. MMS16-BH015]